MNVGDCKGIKDSYACIKERGREKAASRLQYWLRQTERKPKQYYYLKLDISKFFYRVDHEVLLNILKRRIKDERLIKLFDKIINSEKRAFGLPLGVDPCEIDPREMLFDKGMPIGNLTSQMFANIYMNELDQYLKHELHLKYVIRYADDCIILHDSKEELWQVLEKVETFLLENLKLNLNNKTVIRPTTCNIDFVGYMINKDEIRLRSATVKRMRSRIKYIVKAYERGEMTLQEVNATMQSYFGLIKHCTNEGLRENIIKGEKKHKRKTTQKRATKGESIENRPEEIDTRETFGHWEMDTVVGARGVSKKSLLVLTERKTRKEIIFLLKEHTAAAVVKALDRLERKTGAAFRKIFKTITVDNGSEFADWQGMERSKRNKKNRTKVYYCHPYSSWERGSNENQNKLVRRHIPKGVNFDDKTQGDIDNIAEWINNYPRRLFEYQSAEKLYNDELKKIAA